MSLLKGKLLKLDFVFVLSFSIISLHLVRVCFIVNLFAFMSTLSHFNPKTSLRLKPYKAVIRYNGYKSSSLTAVKNFF